MHKNIWQQIILSGLIIFISACGQSKKLPDDIIPPDLMQAILIDLHLAEAEILEQRYRIQDSAKKDYAILEDSIFALYKVDTAQYQRSYQYYSQNVELFQGIYDAVLDTLVYRESIAKSKLSPDDKDPEMDTKPNQKINADSLKKLSKDQLKAKGKELLKDSAWISNKKRKPVYDD